MKPAQIRPLDAALVDKAVRRWKAGETVAIPTETVYGLAADACNGAAVARIYALKSRPQFNPLIVHVADAAMAQRYVQWNDRAQALADAFWPGPLTLVLKRRSDCPISELVSAGGDTLAVRVPAHPLTRQLLQAFGGGLAAPSANRSGRVSPTTAQHVRDEFADAVMVLDGGACDVGIESTVVDLSGDAPSILRPGSITRAMINAVIPAQAGLERSKRGDPLNMAEPTHDSGLVAEEVMDPGLRRDDSNRMLLSPGQMESHYAPSIPVRLNATDVAEDEALLAFGPPLSGAAKTENLSPSGDLIEAAANLFSCLRALDDPALRGIAVMPVPADGIGEAINDRLQRAAA